MSFKALLSSGMVAVSKHSPEILVVSGVVGVVVAGVMACKATLKVNEIIDEHNENMDKIRKVGAEDRDDYTKDDVKKDTTIQYVHTIGKLIKLYGPAILIAVLSIIAIFVSNNMLRKRCLAVAAAYTATDNAFKAYRQRVVDKYGEEEDHKLYFGTEEIEVTEMTEDGKTKKTKKKVTPVSDYGKYFAKSTSKYWEDDSNYNEYFISLQEAYANKLLQLPERKCITLNEVYRLLGLEETDDGMVVGWIYDRDNPVGDNYIQIYAEPTTIINKDGKEEDAFALDFNVDGLIHGKI